MKILHKLIDIALLAWYNKITNKTSHESEEMDMTKETVLENLIKLIGQAFDENEIICAFEDFEEDGETEVYVGDSSNNGYDKIAYINAINATQFLFTLDSDDLITDVLMA